MDGRKQLTTEVQIRKSRSHLLHLNKILSLIASGLGMSRKDIEETETMVNEVCMTSIERTPDAQENLSVKLTTHDTHMTVEITDRSTEFDLVCTEGLSGDYNRFGNLERFCHLVDGLDFIRGEMGTTIRITKYANKLADLAHLSSLGTTSLQV